MYENLPGGRWYSTYSTIIDAPSLDSACISTVIHSTAPLEVCEPEESALPPLNNLEVQVIFSLHNPQAVEESDPRHAMLDQCHWDGHNPMIHGLKLGGRWASS